MGVKERVFSILGQELAIDPSTLDPEQDIRQQFDTDTLGIVRCASKIEQHFDVDLPISIVETRTLNELLEMVHKVVEERRKARESGV
ncbi:MAG: hypothetical protein GF350_08175 [Chitinivibrionales bacterium]|nr:hypothetical protein [Chitinivibrionales bacterium]